VLDAEVTEAEAARAQPSKRSQKIVESLKKKCPKEDV